MWCPRRTLLSLVVGVTFLLSLTSLLAASGCASASKDAGAAVTPGPGAQPILQFAAVAEPGGEPAVAEYEHGNEKLRLGKLRIFEIRDAGLSSDAMGWPALSFEIADRQREEFRRWTESLVDHRMAMLIDGKVVSAPTVKSALSGGGIVEFDGKHLTEDEVRKLADRIREQIGGTKK